MKVSNHLKNSHCPRLIFGFLFFILLTFPAIAAEDLGSPPEPFNEIHRQVEEARSALGKSRSKPAAPPERQKYQTALSLLRQGDNYSANQIFKELLGSRKTPREVKNEVLLTLGFLNLEQKKPEDAIEAFSKVINLPEMRERALFGTAWAFFYSSEYIKAITQFEEVGRQYPGGNYALESMTMIGQSYSRLLAFDKSAESYRDTLRSYGSQIRQVRELIQKTETGFAFDRNAIFQGTDGNSALWIARLREDPYDGLIVEEVASFFDLEAEGLKTAPAFFSKTRESLAASFKGFLLNRMGERQKKLEILSVQAATGLARNMLLQSSGLEGQGAPQ